MRGAGNAIFLIVGLALLQAGCGGRVAKPVAATRSFDSQLSCDHLAAELDVNRAKAADLLGEKRNANDNTAAMAAGAILVPAYLLFLDLSDTEKKEAAALAARNEELLKLAKAKDCPMPPSVPVMAAADPTPATPALRPAGVK